MGEEDREVLYTAGGGQHFAAVTEGAWNLDECTCISQILLLSKQRGGCGGVLNVCVVDF